MLGKVCGASNRRETIDRSNLVGSFLLLGNLQRQQLTKLTLMTTAEKCTQAIDMEFVEHCSLQHGRPRGLSDKL
ncbi:hypothetical protein [Acidovorax cavernicola]|uniref:Uncharacterized protein n=1 Tax=Acidovorax cavernicola TaxID=1675792 RepID=A0A9X8GVV3_9BURK|nr:hypothetical protein [Acidovorax cavernicola]RIX80284.1 hypothetical protein D3H34_13150 [Acidovorax cavernicola]